MINTILEGLNQRREIHKVVESVLEKYGSMDESHIDEISKLDLINQNKAKYEYVQKNASKFIKDKIDKAITDTLILRWIKGKNWEGGLGNGRDVNNLWETLMNKYSLDADVIYDKFQDLCDFWEDKFTKEGIN